MTLNAGVTKCNDFKRFTIETMGSFLDRLLSKHDDGDFQIAIFNIGNKEGER